MEGLKMVQPMPGAEIVMRDIGARYAEGVSLTMAEQNMAMLATATLNAEQYGPSPGTMKLTPPGLPENVKGALAKYSV